MGAAKRAAHERKMKLKMIAGQRRKAAHWQKMRLLALKRRTIRVQTAFKNVKKFTVKWYYYRVRWNTINYNKFYTYMTYWRRLKNTRNYNLWRGRWLVVKRRITSYRKR